MSKSNTIWSVKTEFAVLNIKQIDYLNENHVVCSKCGNSIHVGEKVQLIIFHDKNFNVRHLNCQINDSVELFFEK